VSIVLSASVRQNLLSLQSTASLLATTQNDLATGNKVNSALDNPTSYFTAASLNNRASDISNLLDGIGNGVQVLQAANTGITSLQSLVSSAQSIANQVLQAPVGYSTKANAVSAAITASGAPVTAGDLRGSGTVLSNAVTGSTVNATSPVVAATLSTKLSALGITSDQIIGFSVGTVNFASTTGSHVIPTTSNTTLDLSTATVQDFINAANLADNGSETWALNGSGHLTVTGPGGATGSVNNGGTSGTALTALGLSPTSWTNTNETFGALTTGGSGPITSGSTLATLNTALTTSDTLTVNGKSITFNNGSGTSISAGGASIDLSSASISDVLSAIDTISGTATASTVSGGKITLNTGTSNDLNIAGSALAKLGLGAGDTERTGLSLSFAAVGNGTATTVTFGDGTGGTVKSLNDLNNALAGDNLIATLDGSGKLSIETNNDNASKSISVSGTATTVASGAFKASNGAVTTTAPVSDPNSQATRASLVAQYNNVLAQINTTAQDASFNGVNLLGGDTLKLVFNETGKSTLSITGVTFNDSGLGLSTLTGGTDFLDSSSADSVLSTLNAASTTLRSEASALGSNLSVVQIRQDFNKNLIDVLQTGASTLTLADTNQEAANSQALSTRQSIAVSALALANQSQASVLQLLR
jgi:flagellin-like hook-associated protein FlgL